MRICNYKINNNKKSISFTSIKKNKITIQKSEISNLTWDAIPLLIVNATLWGLPFQMNSFNHHNPKHNQRSQKNTHKERRQNREENIRLQNRSRVKRVIKQNQQNRQHEDRPVLESLNERIQRPVELQVPRAEQNRENKQSVP